MKQSKPTNTLDGEKCPICSKGEFRTIQTDYVEDVAEDNPVEFKGIWVDRCSECGETVFPPETTWFIEACLAERSEQLTPRDLERVREDADVDQTEMSEILGLGAKTYHRWEKGQQFPTRSMCYYIRVLAEFPEAFDWLRKRQWRVRNRLSNTSENLALMFPDLDSRIVTLNQERHSTFITGRSNPALGLRRVTFEIK